MAAEPLEFYPLIENVDPIISPILARFTSDNPNFTCEKSLEIYNNSDNPLFKISSIEILMGKTDILRVIRSDQKLPANDRMYTQGEDFVYGMSYSHEGSNYKRKGMFFTRRGFQIYLMTSRGDISNLFRKFLLVVLDELHTKGFVKNAEALRITEEKYRAEIKNINERFTYIKESLEHEQIKRKEAEDQLAESGIIADKLMMITGHQKKQIQLAHEYNQNMEADFPASKEVELRILKMKYLRTIRVYLVPYEKIVRAQKEPAAAAKPSKAKNRIYEYMSKEKVEELGLDDSSSDDGASDYESNPACGIQPARDPSHARDYVCEYDYSSFGLSYPPDPNDSYYYAISPTKKLSTSLGIHVADLYVSNSEHYAGLKEYLIENCSTSVRGVFMTTLTELEEKLREVFIQRNRHALP